jgi:hypothetical protein
MDTDPLQSKEMAIEQAIKDLATNDRGLRLNAITALGVVIKVSEYPHSETRASNALSRALQDEDRAVQRAAKRAMRPGKVKKKDIVATVDMMRRALDK